MRKARKQVSCVELAMSRARMARERARGLPDPLKGEIWGAVVFTSSLMSNLVMLGLRRLLFPGRPVVIDREEAAGVCTRRRDAESGVYISDYERGYSTTYIHRQEPRTIKRLMKDLARPGGRAGALVELLERIPDHITRDWVRAHVEAGDLKPLLLAARPGTSELELWGAWRLSADAEELAAQEVASQTPANGPVSTSDGKPRKG
jgi:hypothetical protein